MEIENYGTDNLETLIGTKDPLSPHFLSETTKVDNAVFGLETQYNQALSIAYTRLEEFVNSEEFQGEMEIAFGTRGKTSKAQTILEELISREKQPEIEIFNGQDLGARGAYVTETNTIYLSWDRLTGQPEITAKIIVEEIGHYLDAQIDLEDAVGDEGEIFAAIVFGDSLSSQELSVMKAENDTVMRYIDGELVSIEQASVHLAYGNPSGGSNYTYSDYFLDKPQYALSYNSNIGTANWVSWQLNNNWFGSASRQNDFRSDPSLPSVFYPVDGDDYQGSGYDRGHLVASADRTRTTTDNSSTFYMTNMIPQSPGNNQGPWRELEEFSRYLVTQGKELYIVAGGEGSLGTIANGNVTVPAYTWKTILVQDGPGAQVNENTDIIAIRMPNNESVRGRDWRDYLVSVNEIESRTGLDFYSLVPDSIENQIESRVYGTTTSTPTTTIGSASGLSISSLLPNPSGDENFNEAAAIVNQGSSSVSLVGWKLRDLANTTWSLDSIGILDVNRSANIRRENQSMSLNNSGDTIQLIDPNGNVVDTVTYQNALSDRVIFF